MAHSMGPPMEVGDRVLVDGQGGEVAFIGDDLPDMPAGRWVGVVYDEPVGKNDGTVKGRRLFKCRKNHGHLLRPDKIKVNFAETAMKRQAMGKGPSLGHAARSHELNDKYMQDFNTAYAMLESDDFARLDSGGGGAGQRDNGPRRQGPAPGGRAAGALAVGRAGGGMAGRGGGVGDVVNLSRQLETVSLLNTRLASWKSGPIDPQGKMVDVSDRPNTCISVRGSEAVIGSTDHALYVIDIAKGIKSRTLYTKACGHTEWVTCCTHLNDGRLVSGGMDGKLCLWGASGARCVDLQGHQGSITAVRATVDGLVLSGAYDACVGVWDCSRHPSRSLSSLLRGHKAPITSLALGQQGEVVSGGRDGTAFIWDLQQQSESRRLGGHGGHVTSCSWIRGSLFATGAQDGKVRVWDARSDVGGRPVHTVPAHVLPTGSGAVGDIAVTGVDMCSPIITAGADARVQVLDPRNGFEPMHTLTAHKDFIYSLALAGDVVLSGDGKGMLLAHDWKTGALCYGLGANSAAVRCIAVAAVAGGDALVTSGDDGNVLVYDYR